MPVAPLTHLGSMPVAAFMRRYWQRRPLLVRGALPQFASPVDRRRLFELATRRDVESRLVTQFDGWQLANGPLRRLPSSRRPGWTLLVQGVDLHDERAAQLLARFRFVADARLDDLMVSYASDGGGVGPHVDAYDVFLLQAQGRRRWRLGDRRRTAPAPGLPLRILRNFRALREWVLEPGDLLYLPPGVPHDGTAVGGDCITCSIGFRAPAWQELLEPWLDALASRIRVAGRFRDPGARPTATPARLPARFVRAAFHSLARARPTRADAARLLLSVLSEPKPNVVFDPPRVALSDTHFQALTAARGLRLDRRTRMLYAGARVAVNGELFDVAARDRASLHALADRREIAPAQVRALGAQGRRLLADWYRAGWLSPSAPGRIR
jgi:50S ribosomal protein L16 3-hydroxylase